MAIAAVHGEIRADARFEAVTRLLRAHVPWQRVDRRQAVEKESAGPEEIDLVADKAAHVGRAIELPGIEGERKSRRGGVAGKTFAPAGDVPGLRSRDAADRDADVEFHSFIR